MTPTAPPITFPPHLVVVERRSYTREASESRSPRRFSHSRGRPPGTRSDSFSRSEASESVSRDRSESDYGSRAPLWRRREGVQDPQPSASVAAGPPVVTETRDRLHPLVAHFLGFRSTPPALGPALPFLSPENATLLFTFIGSFGSILIVCAVSMGLVLHFPGIPLAIGSLGATAVLLYAVPEGPLSQPKALVGGHVISAVTGVCVRRLFELSPKFSVAVIANASDFDSLTAVAGALAVAIAILLMQLTKTVHPPGGATALIAVFTRSASWAYILMVLFVVVAMGLWACIIINLSGLKRYPVHWWNPPPPPQKAVPDVPVEKVEPVEYVEHVAQEGSPEIALAVLGEEEEEEMVETRGRTSRR